MYFYIFGNGLSYSFVLTFGTNNINEPEREVNTIR